MNQKGTDEINGPYAKSPSKAFPAPIASQSYDFALSRLAKNVGIGLLGIKCAGVVIVRKLRRSIRVVQSPSSFWFSLVAQTGTCWFPRLVKGLEVENVFVPAKQSAHAVFEEGVSFIDTVYSSSIAGSG